MLTINKLIMSNLLLKKLSNKKRIKKIKSKIKKIKRSKNLLIKLPIWLNLKLKSKPKILSKILNSVKLPKIKFGSPMIFFSLAENLLNSSRSTIFIKKIFLLETCSKSSNLLKWLQLLTLLGLCKNQEENSMLVFPGLLSILMLWLLIMDLPVALKNSHFEGESNL